MADRTGIKQNTAPFSDKPVLVPSWEERLLVANLFRCGKLSVTFGDRDNLALYTELVRDPAPLGKVLAVIERRFLHARSAKPAFKLGITVVDRPIAVRGNADTITIPAVELRDDPSNLDMLNGAKHTVLHTEVAAVLQEHDPVTRCERSFPVVGLERQFSTLLALPQPMAVLQGRSDRGIDGPHVGPPMRHGNTGAVRTLLATGKVITHDLRARLVAIIRETQVAMLGIVGKPLSRPVRRKGGRRLPLPVHALPADFGQLGVADLLGNRPERCPGPDRL
jgi:hypothetical protein